jgi:hypothetical protein
VLNGHEDGASVLESQRIGAVGLIDSSDVVLYFLDSVGVALIAGAAYGLFATSIETFAAGMERLAGAVSKLR